jgi:hypothetical protein
MSERKCKSWKTSRKLLVLARLSHSSHVAKVLVAAVALVGEDRHAMFIVVLVSLTS